MRFIKKHIWAIGCLTVVLITLWPTLNNEILLWDDKVYITDNPLLKEFSWNNTKEIFTTPHVNSHYHPLTILSWNIDYQIGELNPATYHWHNMILHLLNCLLVYGLVYILFKKQWMAIAALLLFGIHPMHVESVAWLSSRKDLLYSFYYLLALLLYTRRFVVPNKSLQIIIGVFFLFGLSLLSKGMAITLPAALLLLDYFHERKDFKILLAEKIPFFLLSAVFLYIGIQQQISGDALSVQENTSPINGLFVASHGLIFYLVKFIAPTGLSALHPYPAENLPWQFYASIVPVLILAILLFKRFKKDKVFVFSSLFFIFSLIPVIQLVPVGMAHASERYTYLPYLGLIIYGLHLIGKLLHFRSQYQRHIIAIGVIGLLSFAFLSNKISGVWNNDLSLWKNVAKQYPNHHFAYANIGDYYFSNGNNQEALEYYNTTIELEGRYFMAYNNRGLIHQYNGNFEQAIADFEQTTSLSDYPKGYINKGALLFQLGKDSLALEALNKGILLDTTYALAWYNRANVHFRILQFEDALFDINQAEKLGYTHPNLKIIKSKIFTNLNDPERALAELEGQVQLYPNHIGSRVELGWNYHLNKEYTKAIEQYSVALANGPERNLLVNRGLSYFMNDEYNKALKDLNDAYKIDSSFFPIYHNRALVHQQLGNFELALSDFNKGITMTDQPLAIIKDKAKFLISTKQYQIALEGLLSYNGEDDGEWHYLKAICFEQLGNKEQYKIELKLSENLGYLPMD